MERLNIKAAKEKRRRMCRSTKHAKLCSASECNGTHDLFLCLIHASRLGRGLTVFPAPSAALFLVFFLVYVFPFFLISVARLSPDVGDSEIKFVAVWADADTGWRGLFEV